MLRIFQPYKVTSVLVAARTDLPLDFQEIQNKISSFEKDCFRVRGIEPRAAAITDEVNERRQC